MLSLSEGRYELARSLASETVTACDALNIPVGNALSQVTLGYADLAEGRYEEARKRFLRA